MMLARKMGILAYRSRAEFDSRFDWRYFFTIFPNLFNYSGDKKKYLHESNYCRINFQNTCRYAVEEDRFEVQHYLDSQARKFVAGDQSFDPNCYLVLSKVVFSATRLYLLEFLRNAMNNCVQHFLGQTYINRLWTS